MKPVIHVVPGEITIEHADLLKMKGQKLGTSFARRALAVPGVEAVAIDTLKGRARITYHKDPKNYSRLLERVIGAMGSEADALGEDQVANLEARTMMHWVRAGAHIQPLTISVPKEGHLIVEDEAFIATKSPLLRFIKDSVRTLTGIQSITLEPQGQVHIHYNTRRITPEKLIPLIEQAYSRHSDIQDLKDPKSVPMKVSGTTVGIWYRRRITAAGGHTHRRRGSGRHQFRGYQRCRPAIKRREGRGPPLPYRAPDLLDRHRTGSGLCAH